MNIDFPEPLVQGEARNTHFVHLCASTTTTTTLQFPLSYLNNHNNFHFVVAAIFIYKLDLHSGLAILDIGHATRTRRPRASSCLTGSSDQFITSSILHEYLAPIRLFIQPNSRHCVRLAVVLSRTVINELNCKPSLGYHRNVCQTWLNTVWWRRA